MRLAVTTCAVIVLGLGVGCGGEESGPAPTVGPAPAEPAAEPSAEVAAEPSAEAAADAPAEAAAAAPEGPAPAGAKAVVPAPEGAAGGPELGERPDRIPSAEELPQFDQGTVAVTIQLPRKMSGQVDFIAKDAQATQGFRVVHAQRFTDSDTIHVNAPSGYPESLYVLVHEFPDGIPVYGPQVSKGVVKEPVTFDSPGAEYVVAWGNDADPDWLAEVFRPGEGDPVPDDSEKEAGAKP